MELSQTGTTIKTEEETLATSTVYSGSEIDLNDLQQEPGLMQSVESEPAMLVKKEIVDNGSEDDSEKQCSQDASTSAGAGSLYETNSTSQTGWNNVKPEMDEMDIGPTVLQHMDIQYALNKSTVDGCSKAMRCSGVMENAEDKLTDSLTPRKTMTKKQIHMLQSLQRIVLERHLTSICCVHVMRLDIFQCDVCHALYTERDRLLQHMQAVHAYHPQTSLIFKVHKINKPTSADNKATLHNYDQTTTEVDYDETHMKSHRGQQEDRQKHRATSSKGFKCDRTFRKQHLLSGHNNLHQQNSRKVVTARGSVASSCGQIRDKRTKTEQKPFECDVCEKGYSSKAGLNLHKCSRSSIELRNHLAKYESHTRKKHYPCNKKFTQGDDYLSKSMRGHTGEKPYPCTICDARFAFSSHLTRHWIVHSGEKPNQCKICDARFAQSGHLIQHMRVHTGEKPYQCKICGARFAQITGLTQHVRVHTGEKPYQCKICDARFAQNGNLTEHMKIHTGEKPYQCKNCGARFSKSTSLTQHVRVHTGEKPYQCTICGARFAQKAGLTQHVRVHTGEKPYHCKICDARFASNGNFAKHVRVHTGEKRYHCKICKAKFARNSDLTKHIRVHTGEKHY